MIDKRFDEIDKSDIESLISAQVPEGRSIEYKSQAPGKSDQDVVHFLGSVCAMANADGGDILHGLGVSDASKGVPTSASGLQGVDADVVIRRIDDLVRTHIDPKIQGIRIRPISGFANGDVIVVRVPRSASRPHMMTFNHLNRFCARGSASNYIMDVRQIRTAFLLSEDPALRAKRFREQRLALIMSGDTPVPLGEGPVLVLHVLPWSAFDPLLPRDLAGKGEDVTLDLQPMLGGGYNHRYNMEGFVTYSGAAYVQAFRSGAIEAAVRVSAHGPSAIPGLALHKEAAERARKYLAAVAKMGIEPPVYVAVSLVFAKGWSVSAPAMFAGTSYPFDRDVIELPEVVIDSFECGSLIETLKPAFSILWQAAGYPHGPVP